MKAQAFANHLAENPVDDEYQPLSTYFPDGEVSSIEVIPEGTNAWKMFFDGDVNAKDVGIRAILISPTGQHYPATARLRFFCTNNIAEYEACIMGEWETRDIKLIPYRKHVEDLSKRLKSIEFGYIPRFHNELADALATLAVMLPYPGNVYINPLEIQIRERHGYCNIAEIEPNIQLWYHNIKRFLKTKEYPEQASRDQKRIIRRLSSSFFLIEEVLYKRTPDLNLLRFILVAIDYFTKWIETVTFKAITKKAVVDFVHSNIICRFGIPKTIITDNAANLNRHLMREVCEQFKIINHNSTPYRPKANSAVETTNKNIKKILKKMIQSSRQWHEKLPFALLGYRTTVRTSIGETPYLLVYGIEAVMSAEVEIPYLRIIVEAEIEDDEWVKTYLEQLTMIDEKRMAAVCHEQLYQQRMARAYNKKVWPRNFELEQFVLRRILPHHEEAKGKFSPNWKGLYIVRKLLPKGALYLGDITRNDPETAVNADAVKRKTSVIQSNLAKKGATKANHAKTKMVLHQ
ncbi:uncharacterized protein [Nicotiana sylvestris]|uniref:uncharacterized protein n=1 Tax=Nicotiana sylvestris TaxID=4096 RepID=UPI00388CD16D